MQAKTVQVHCHHPIAIDPTAEDGWDDCHLYFKTRPRRRHWYLLVLLSRPAVEFDLQIHVRAQTDHPALDYEHDIQEDHATIATLDTGAFAIGPMWDGCVEVATPQDRITRAHADEMIRYWLAQQGYQHVKLQWIRPKIIAVPIG